MNLHDSKKFKPKNSSRRAFVIFGRPSKLRPPQRRRLRKPTNQSAPAHQTSSVRCISTRSHTRSWHMWFSILKPCSLLCWFIKIKTKVFWRNLPIKSLLGFDLRLWLSSLAAAKFGFWSSSPEIGGVGGKKILSFLETDQIGSVVLRWSKRRHLSVKFQIQWFSIKSSTHDDVFLLLRLSLPR